MTQTLGRRPSVPANPLAFDRYSYTFNNPIRYTDPTGHSVADDTKGGCGLPSCIINPDSQSDPTLGGNNESSELREKARETSGKRPSVGALVAIGLLLTGAVVLAEIGLTAAEIAIGTATLAQPELAPLTIPLELTLVGASLATGDLEVSYLVYTYRVASVPENEDVKFELLPPWGLKFKLHGENKHASHEHSTAADSFPLVEYSYCRLFYCTSAKRKIDPVKIFTNLLIWI